MYHKVIESDCFSVATIEEKARLGSILNMALLTSLAKRWCNLNGYDLWSYLGNSSFDATKHDEGVSCPLICYSGEGGYSLNSLSLQLL